MSEQNRDELQKLLVAGFNQGVEDISFEVAKAALGEKIMSPSTVAQLSIGVLRAAAYQAVVENPGKNTTDIGAILGFPHWFDPNGYVIRGILEKLEQERLLESSGGGRGRHRCWVVAT